MTDLERTLRARAELHGYSVRKLAVGPDFVLIGDGGQSVVGPADMLRTFLDEEFVKNIVRYLSRLKKQWPKHWPARKYERPHVTRTN